MMIKNTETPVLTLNCTISGLAISRSLGSLGVPIYCIDDNPKNPAQSSRYLKKKFLKKLDENNPDEYLESILKVADEIGQKSILIPTSDELTLFVLQFKEYLKQDFIFPDIDYQLAKNLVSKKEMFHIATKKNIPTPKTLFPENIEEVKNFAENIRYPVLLKGIHGNRLKKRTRSGMILVNDSEELFEKYVEFEDPSSPNLMLQEHIPGGDDQVYFFNGYFDYNYNCLSAYTGRKIRQAPIHFGVASLGECKWNEEVADMTIEFMKSICYRGILDIGYRLDPRDQKYKILDINPRVGGAFRLFVSDNGMDVVRSMYLDLTGQDQEAGIMKSGRRWMIEDYDLVSTYEYFKEGSLGFSEWLKSFKGLEEAAWFSWKDPMPFCKLWIRFIKRFINGGWKRI